MDRRVHEDRFFSTVLVTDECRATLTDQTAGVKVGYRLHRLRLQQGGGEVMFWAGIVGCIMVGPWKVQDGVKMILKAYVTFLNDNFQPWFKKQKI